MEKVSMENFKSIIANNLGIDFNEIKPESNLIHDFRVDSLSLVNFILKLEIMFGIKFPIDKLIEMKDINSIYNMINEVIEEKTKKE